MKDKPLDLWASVAGIAILLSLTPWIVHRGYHPVFLAAVGIGVACIVLYLVAIRQRVEASSPTIDANAKSWLPIALAFGFCTLAWVAFLLRPEVYVKPTTYYVFMAFATGAAFYGALKHHGKRSAYTIVGLACVIGLSHIYTEHLLFPSSLIGIDPWVHQTKTAEPLLFASLGGRLSLMHPYLKHIMEMTGLSYKWASLTFVGAVNTVAMVCLAFAIGRRLFNQTVGCVASLMIASANWTIFFGEWVIPNTLGGMLSLLAVHLTLKVKDARKLIPVMVSLVAVSYLIHILVAVWVLGALFCLYALPAMFSRGIRLRDRIARTLQLSAPLLLTAVFPVSVLAFTYMGASLQRTVEVVAFNPSFGVTVTSIYPGITSTLGTSTVGEMIAASLGMLLYIGLAIVGCLIMLKKAATPIHKALIVLCLGTLSIGFFPRLFGISLIEHRWWYLTMTLMAVPLGLSLIKLSSISRVWQIASVTLVVVIVFLSTIGLASNMSNRTLFPNLTVRYAFTDTEMASLDRIEEYSGLVIGADPVFSLPVAASARGFNSTAKVVPLTNELITGNFSDSRVEVLLLRDALNKEPFGVGDGDIYMLHYGIVATAKQYGFRLAWNNEEVTWLIRKRP